MCAKRYNLVLPSSSQRIRNARKSLRKMSKVERIDLIVAAGSMTEQQAEKAKKKVAEIEDGSHKRPKQRRDASPSSGH